MSFEVRQGDCVSLMAAMPAASVDAVVCDPPYGLEFMGKDWDRLPGSASRASQIPSPKQAATFPLQSRARSIAERQNGPEMQQWHQAWATEALRVLKPGGHLLAFGGTRTYHRLVCAVEDAGFEIRDTISWLYGSGFPKSLNVGAAIDRAAGAEREVVGVKHADRYPNGPGGVGFHGGPGEYSQVGRPPEPQTAPVTPEAERWEGWGTALKPAMEPVVVARKPLSGTVAGNVLEHGVGALNIDGTRVDTGDNLNGGAYAKDGTERHDGAENWRYKREGGAGEFEQPAGRWPANVVLDGEAARLLDEQAGELHTHSTGTGSPADYGERNTGMFTRSQVARPYGNDSGGASRFFYVAKASRGERNAGLEGFEEQPPSDQDKWSVKDRRSGTARNPEEWTATTRNHHPTVKPISLMRWLVRLVTPPNGVVLDPFAGSGTTGCAAVLEGFDFVGLEREPEYVAIAEARIAWWHKHRGDGEAADILAAGELRDSVEATGQLGMFD